MSIKTGTVTASVILRKLAAYPRQNSLALALRELGKLERTFFTLQWLQDPELRRRSHVGLNKGEQQNALRRAVFFNRLGEIRDLSYENQRHRASGLNLLVAAIILWNTTYLQRAVDHLRDQRQHPAPGDLAHLSPLGWEHINLTGDYHWETSPTLESPHNPPANMAGIMKDITLVLDGQQRITSLFIGLRGSFRYFYYRWKKTRLYLNLLKKPVPDEENPEELTYAFVFREGAEPDANNSQLWYLVGRILDFEDAEDAKSDMKGQLAELPEDQQENANKMIGRLHNRIHTTQVGNYYQERSQDYDKVLQMFVRANSAGQPLAYSDLLLATATAKWEELDARSEIYDFTDSLNKIVAGDRFAKDFVLKACLYLSEDLPIQYRVKNFTRQNLRTIEGNWGKIKESLSTTVRLISRFGFRAKNLVAPLALLPIAFYLMKRGNSSFDTSSETEDADIQVAIRKWFVFSTLKNAFGGSSDTTLTRLREVLSACGRTAPFPVDALYKSLEIEPNLSDTEIEHILEYGYQGRYTNLVLSLLYPDRDWKNAVFHEDHIFPKSKFQVGTLKKRGYDEAQVQSYMSKCNTLPNLQLITDSENLSKHATPFERWIQTRDAAFRSRHMIPDLDETYGFDTFGEFWESRAALIRAALSKL